MHSRRFRWIVCQVEALRNCFPSAVLRALDDPPKRLDETYNRILLGIPQERRECAQRLLHCLAVSVRPLRVEELAEILAINFDAGSFPRFDINLRPANPQEAVLLACSSLITIVNMHGSRVVQFSHFSVKEYLSSERLANAAGHLSQYHILPHSAHTILAKASLSALLALDSQVDKESVTNFPLTIYAAQFWVKHAKFEDVSSGIEDEMKLLFDIAKPHFAIWVWVYDIDLPFREVLFAPRPTRPRAVPLYYAALCGFSGLVKHLIDTCPPQDIDSRGGCYATPLHAAVIKENVDVTMLLLARGADTTALDYERWTSLHRASQLGYLSIVELLIEYYADVDARDGHGATPLYLASQNGKLDVARVLLLHGASPDSHDHEGWAPLMIASSAGHLDIVRLLLKSGAAADTHNNDGMTPLKLASRNGRSDVIRLLLQSDGVP